MGKIKTARVLRPVCILLSILLLSGAKGQSLPPTAIRKEGTIENKTNEEGIQSIGTENGRQIICTSYSNLSFHKESSNLQYNIGFEQALLSSGSPKEEASLLSCINVGANQQTPEEQFSVSVVATGPYYAPACVELVANVIHPTNTAISKVEFYNGDALLQAVTEPPYELSITVPIGIYQIQAKAYDENGNTTTATAEFEVVPSNWYRRGWGLDPKYLSTIIAIDGQKGVFLDQIVDFSKKYPFFPWFLRTDSDTKEVCWHVVDPSYIQAAGYDSPIQPVNVIPTINNVAVGAQPPMVAFGSEGGGSPLYINQNYSFGLLPEVIASSDGIKIEVYDKDDFALGKTNVKPVIVKTYSPPCMGDFYNWEAFYNNGHVKEIHLQESINGKIADFETQLQYVPRGLVSKWYCYFSSSPLMVTHRAANNDFYYKVSFQGTLTYPFGGSQEINEAASHYNISYSLDFSNPAPWSVNFLNQPYFQSIPIPAAYEGKSVDELIRDTQMVKDTLMSPEDTGLNLTQVNNSPELKSHSELDQFSSELGNDPMVIANYVQNEIELTDAIGLNTTETRNDHSLNSQGVMRDAFATYLEGRGSPIEQCALLIYLLRKAGVPAAYVFPKHNTTLMFDEQLSKVLHMQIRGTLSVVGESYLPALIPVNYPWVAAYINGKWIHLFPWIKDTEVNEGKDIWNYFPNGYQKAEEWICHYILNDPTIRGLSEHGKEDNAGALFKLYAQEQLKKVNLELADVGIKFKNRSHHYTDWNDFPRPWQTATISNDNLVQNLDDKQNPKFANELTNIFDTVNIQVISDRNHNGVPAPDAPILETGPMRFVDLHNRRLLLYHELIPDSKPVQYNMILSLEPYDTKSSETVTYSFNQGNHHDPGDFRSPQKISVILQTTSNPKDPKNDDGILYNITTAYHQKTTGITDDYYSQFPSLWEEKTSKVTRPLRKGDMAALSLCYGRVTEKMLDYEIKKYKNYQQECCIHPDLPKDPEQLTGQILHCMGQGYYLKTSSMVEELENLTKVHTVSWRAYGLSKLSPERNNDGSPVITKKGNDFNLVYPRVDMFFSRSAAVGNESSHLESGDSGLKARDLIKLALVDASAQEHRIINEFFNQDSAISTIKLLDIAQGWTPETGVASHPGTGIKRLDASNYELEGLLVPETDDNSIRPIQLKTWATRGGIWAPVEDVLSKRENFLTTVFLTPVPVTAPKQQGKPYVGMGGLILGDDSSSALISDSLSIDHGGYGGSTSPISSSNPNLDNDFSNQLNNQMNDWIARVKLNEDLNCITNHSKGANNSSSNPPSNSNPSSNQHPPIASPSPDSEPAPPPSSQATPLLRAQLKNLKKEISNRGFMGFPSYYGKLLNHVMDPVSVVTGEFYINALDLKLNGPMPLEIRRIYSSQNGSDNNLGPGWKLGTFPYLLLSVDESDTNPPSLIYAAEMDGSVIAYRYSADQKIWKPEPRDNPNLINPNNGSFGPSQNLFNNTITKGGDYTLHGADGSTRSFTIKSFPVLGSPKMTRTRPYLDTWRDNQGNSYTFTYGIDNKANDYGQLSSITSNNGSNLHFHYDIYGHIVEAFSHDGRRLLYSYDKEGNLIKVTLPDNSVIGYSYQKGTHLLIQETNPNGRILKNNYDKERRVITQASTVGVSPVPTTSATFAYNVTSTNSDNTINGTTTVTDVNGTPTTYTIANSQIAQISYPQNRTLSQIWSNRALANKTDQRGLVTTYAYDAQGNLTSRSLSGNLTGNGAKETATTTFAYNTLNMLTSMTDPVGSSIIYTYGDSAHPYNPTNIVKTANGKTTSTTELSYQAQGLPASVTIDGATASYIYDAHGFLTSITKATGTSDPSVTTTIITNKRGEIVSEIDARGNVKKYSYDAMGRRTFAETFDTTGAPADWHAFYYNENGDLEWEQGARFNPVDYVYYDYDRAGHVIHQGTWSSQATPDGKGVTASSMAAITYTYDNQGNCTSITDPNGHVTTMTYDALGEMLTRTSGDGAASESFTYEAGGKIATHTTVLGGIEKNGYTSTGQLQSVTHADGTTSNYHYDLAGRLVSETLPNGSSWKIACNGNSVTHTFTDASGKSLGSTSESYDGRGNLIEKTDLGGNKWSYTYDGLNRLKTEQGPLTQKTYLYKPGCTSWVNAKGEWKNTFVDAVGRPVLETLFNSDGTIASNISNWYAPDHQSVVTTVGTGSNAITSTLYTDLQDRPLILQHADGSFQLSSYDAVGNKIAFQDEMGNVTTYTYDALNHLTSEKLPDGTTIGYSYNAAGELLTRSMPGGLTEQNSYNEAGQKIADSLIKSDGVTTRNHTYSYTLGCISSISDPRGFTTSISYDSWNKPLSVISIGSTTPEQNQSTTYTYDPRGFLTSVAQSYAYSSTGASTLVSRDYDAEGHLVSESTSLNGKEISSWSQTWDDVGRRTGLNWSIDAQEQGAQYAFSYNALGLITSSQNGFGACSYSYSDQGLLLQKQTPAGTTSLTRNNRGNIISEKLPDGSTESLTYRADGKIGSYAISGPTQNETRNYAYDTRGRLTQEPYTLVISTPAPNVLSIGTQTINYSFDPLTVRMNQEVTTDVANLVTQQNGFTQVVEEKLLNGLLNQLTWVSRYDAAGEVISRTSSLGEIQKMTWDSFGRLIKIEQRNNKHQGYDWVTVYDGLGRRIQTSYADATDQQQTSAPLKIAYYYDPEVAFLELGHAEVYETSNQSWWYGMTPAESLSYTWNLYGPDRSGLYGGDQGIGGLEATTAEGNKEVHGIVNNVFGDSLGVTTNNGFYPWGNVLGGYGAMPGSGVNSDLVPQWRDHYLDWTGFYYMGARYYEPTSGRFLSTDPLGHDVSLSLYDYCEGDPVNGLDPNGRCMEDARKAGLINDIEYQNARYTVQR